MEGGVMCMMGEGGRIWPSMCLVVGGRRGAYGRSVQENCPVCALVEGVLVGKKALKLLTIAHNLSNYKYISNLINVKMISVLILSFTQY